MTSLYWQNSVQCDHLYKYETIGTILTLKIWCKKNVNANLLSNKWSDVSFIVRISLNFSVVSFILYLITSNGCHMIAIVAQLNVLLWFRLYSIILNVDLIYAITCEVWDKRSILTMWLLFVVQYCCCCWIERTEIWMLFSVLNDLKCKKEWSN